MEDTVMAKSAIRSRAGKPAQVTITYDLFDLPTAQHKAGLAGLLLQIESMQSRKLPAPVFRWDDEQPRTKVHVDFTPETTAALFNDLYDATLVEGQPHEKPFTKGKGDAKKVVPWLRRAPMTKRDKKDKEATIEGYVYMELTPALSTLRHYLPRQGEWVRLWRDLLWQIVREGKKKAPFISRAAKKMQVPAGALSDEGDADASDQNEGPKSDGSSWSDLEKVQAAHDSGTFAVGRLSGALLLGAMDKNAETLPLVSRIEHSLLLHFWPLTVLVFVPRFIDQDGESQLGRRSSKSSSPHFAIVVPEVADLRGFINDCPRLLASLSTEMASFRPRESVIDVPAEGGLAFIDHLARLGPQRAASTEFSLSVSAVEYYHLTKEGNNVKFLATGRITPRAHLAEDYQAIIGRPGEKPPYGNPLFRRGLMLALLEEQPWFVPFGNLFGKWSHRFFVSTDDPPKLSWFWADARKKFQEVIKDMPTDPQQSPPDPDDKLAELVYRLVRTYLSVKARDKSGIDPDKFRDGDKIQWEKVPSSYTEHRHQIAETLFLEYRSRRDQAFLDQFVARLASVKQFINEDDYLTVSRALMTRCEDVKTLTLLALSANW
jgi:CRISPR-associated protein Cmx8